MLIGEVKLGEALTSTKIGGKPLRVLAVTEPDAALADRLSYVIADSLINSAKELAEFVVIDSPPLTAVVDAMPLARLADDVLVTARISVSRLSDLSELNDMLREQGCEPTGLVLVGEASTRQGGYYYESTSPPADLQRGIELRQAVADGVGTQSD